MPNWLIIIFISSSVISGTSEVISSEAGKAWQGKSKKRSRHGPYFENIFGIQMDFLLCPQFKIFSSAQLKLWTHYKCCDSYVFIDLLLKWMPSSVLGHYLSQNQVYKWNLNIVRPQLDPEEPLHWSSNSVKKKKLIEIQLCLPCW